MCQRHPVGKSACFVKVTFIQVFVPVPMGSEDINAFAKSKKDGCVKDIPLGNPPVLLKLHLCMVSLIKLMVYHLAIKNRYFFAGFCACHDGEQRHECLR